MCELFCQEFLFQARGGDTYMHRFLRLCFDAITTLLSMYQGNPVLTLLLFGLPGSFLAIIVYMTCCSDFIDAKDEEEEELLDEDEQELGSLAFFP